MLIFGNESGPGTNGSTFNAFGIFGDYIASGAAPVGGTYTITSLFLSPIAMVAEISIEQGASYSGDVECEIDVDGVTGAVVDFDISSCIDIDCEAQSLPQFVGDVEFEIEVDGTTGAVIEVDLDLLDADGEADTAPAFDGDVEVELDADGILLSSPAFSGDSEIEFDVDGLAFTAAAFSGDCDVGIDLYVDGEVRTSTGFYGDVDLNEQSWDFVLDAEVFMTPVIPDTFDVEFEIDMAGVFANNQRTFEVLRYSRW